MTTAKLPTPSPTTPHARWWQLASLVFFLLILYSPYPSDLPDPARRVAAVTGMMGVLWLSQAIPLAITSLLPLVAFPLLGILPAREISEAYMNNNILLFMGGMIIALGLERWGLHRRIALHVCRVVGVGPKRIVLGFMLATAFLSMWISNTATTLLMVPIGLALLTTLGELEEESGQSGGSEALGFPLILSIAYASSIGGMTTLVGTPTNIIFREVFVDSFPDAPEISAGQWIVGFLPIGVLMLLAAWLLLTWRLKPMLDDALDSSFFTNYIRRLGPPTRAEWLMAFVFALTAFLWITRKPLQFPFVPPIPGWGDMIAVWLVDAGMSEDTASKAIDDSTVAIAISTLMFLLPGNDVEGKQTTLMDWATARNLPWRILLLFGGAFALKDGFQASGLSEWIGEQFVGLAGQPAWLMVLITCFVLTFLTEINQNTATCAILLPVLAAAAPKIGVDPRLLMIPAAVSASCAFMLPIATAPNAIAFGSGKISISRMAMTGVWLNLIGVLLFTAAMYLWLDSLFGITPGEVPDWAMKSEG
ncbi:SLC13 family permease [Calycomorphotria hydatis]|uniref:Sodium-dependent dicarboxylate transporter SdcS n=1 Tax=Calycomorphotria hydatis TaxID=2528027 RepID=A0A517T3B2_9PLAN|nr:SLC13 family permease [Calycomorphotria hydatis]QDT62860.1 Sodium-dependent dicarboxylate transporter SdcS [Calycomorphotria hydatis]